MKKVVMVAVTFSVLVLAGLVAILISPAAESPRGQNLTNPRIDRDSFVMADGVNLPFRVWGNDSPLNASGVTQTVVLALHGAGSYSEIFELTAVQWRLSSQQLILTWILN